MPHGILATGAESTEHGVILGLVLGVQHETKSRCTGLIPAEGHPESSGQYYEWLTWLKMTVALCFFVGSIFLSCPSTIISSIGMMIENSSLHFGRCTYVQRIYSLPCASACLLQTTIRSDLKSHWIPQRWAGRSRKTH